MQREALDSFETLVSTDVTKWLPENQDIKFHREDFKF